MNQFKVMRTSQSLCPEGPASPDGTELSRRLVICCIPSLTAPASCFCPPVISQTRARAPGSTCSRKTNSQSRTRCNAKLVDGDGTQCVHAPAQSLDDPPTFLHEHPSLQLCALTHELLGEGVDGWKCVISPVFYPTVARLVMNYWSRICHN